MSPHVPNFRTEHDKGVSSGPGSAVGGASLALEKCFRPSHVAVIGATERPGSVGRTVVENLKRCRASRKMEDVFAIYPINPGRKVCCDLPCFPDIGSCPSTVDLAVVITPAKTVPGVVEACGKAKVAYVIVISAGFKELGPEGLALENEVLDVAAKYHVRIIGPNCLGLMCPHYGLNATFAAGDALPGPIAFISQSGAMCTAVLDWSLKEAVGFSAFVSIGSMADIEWGHLIDFFGNDPHTKAIVLYMETIGNAAHFLSAARTVSSHKPIIVIKAGQTEAAAQAAASHTGSLAGSHDAFLAAMARAGVMVVDSINELFNCARFLSKQPRPAGGNLLIVTNAGGPGVLATDAAALSGATICGIEDTTLATLNTFLPSAWSHANPVDILGDAGAELYAKTMHVALEDKNADGVLIILSPQSVTDSTGTAKAVIAALKQRGATAASGPAPALGQPVHQKPIFCAWMGGDDVHEGYTLLNSNGVPTFACPDDAARTFGKLWQHRKATTAMLTDSTASNVAADFSPSATTASKDRALAVIRAAEEQKRDLLTEAESKLVLKAYGIPIAETVVCSSADAAVNAAREMGYPCVVKLNSETITHKSDVGGVKLNIQSDQAVRDAWTSIKANVDKIGPHHFQGVTVQPMLKLETGIELILGSLVDQQFGPLVLFGFGGCMVEVFRDRSLGLPPLNPVLAEKQLEATKIFKALKGDGSQRFPGVQVKTLATIMCRFSQMIADLAEVVAECDINPLLAMPERFIALDARLVLHKKTGAKTPPAVVIKSYPSQYVFPEVRVPAAGDAGRTVAIYPAHAGDLQRLSRFEKQAKAAAVSGDASDFSVEVAFADYARTLPLLAVDAATDSILGISYLSRQPTEPPVMTMKMFMGANPAATAVQEALVTYSVRVTQAEGGGAIKMLVATVPAGQTSLMTKMGFTCREPAGGKAAEEAAVECVKKF